MISELKNRLKNGDLGSFKLKIKPRAGIDAFLEFDKAGTLVVSLKAKPENNEANFALLKFLAKNLEVPLDRLRIISGQNSRQKLIGFK